MNKILIYLGIAAGVLAAVWFIEKRGADRALAILERQNNEAIELANERDLSLAECDKSLGLYNFRTGKCRLPVESFGTVPARDAGKVPGGPTVD